MKIGIDALPLLGRAGGRSYLDSLLRHLIRQDSENQYLFFFRTLRENLWPARSFGQFSNVSLHRVLIPNRILESLWTKRRVNLPFNREFFKNIDLYFSPTSFLPLIKKCAFVSVVYDLTVLKYPAYKEQQPIFELRLKNILKFSHKIISISEATRKDILNFSAIDPERVETIHLAADERFHELHQDKRHRIKDTLRKYGVDREYWLYVGNLGPHKNLETLVRVFDKAKKIHKIPHKLVLCGQRTWSRDLMETIRRLGSKQEIIIADYVPDEDLPDIYLGADLFVFISLHEGFGLPPLEAMSCGIPVIASNVSSLPEVVGDAAVLVDPLKEDEILQSIMKVLGDSDLRKKLKEKGSRQSKKFSWDDTAKKTLDVFYRARSML